MKQVILVLLALWQLASAKFVYQNYTATYEQFNEDGSGSSPQLPGPYEGLFHGLQLSLFNYAGGFCFGVCSQSFPFSGLFNTVTAPRSANLSVAYPGSRVDSFTLQQFYFGCLARNNVSESSQPVAFDPFLYDPANCTLTVQGFRKAAPRRGAKPDVSATFKYVPAITYNNPINRQAANMRLVKLPRSFKDLKLVTFNATARQPPYFSQPLVMLDNVAYITRNATKKEEA